MLIRTALAIFISLPAIAQQQQQVKPILSDTYKKLVQKIPGEGNPTVDSSLSSLQHSSLTNGDNFYYYYQNGNIQRITVQDNKIKLSPLVHRQLIFLCSYTGSVTAVSANRQPQLQQEYAQGRSSNGELIWQGAETNEPLSYGPRLSQLEYDGVPYRYDINGRLVFTGEGKGVQANDYNNSIVHRATEWRQRLSAMAELRENQVQKYYTKITVGQSREQLVIQDNENNGGSFGFTAGITLFSNLKIAAGIETQQQNFTNGNRNGLLNRVYQQSLLTPASFSNSQGYLLDDGQRSFSNNNDNPHFLLSNTNPYKHENQQMQCSAEYKGQTISFKSIYTPSEANQFHNEGYLPGTVFFPPGIKNYRHQKNKSKILINSFSYNSRWRNNMQHSVNASVSNNWWDIKTAYPLRSLDYNWKRNTTDAAFLYNGSWSSDRNFEAGVSMGNNFYLSSTAEKNHVWLPVASVYIRWNRILNRGSLRLYANTKKLVHEPSLTQSYAGISSIGSSAEQAMRFFPLKEVNNFGGLAAEKHTQYNAGISFYYSYSISFSANAYVTHVKDAIFPTLHASGIRLANMASYRNAGIELQLNSRVQLNNNYRNFFSNTISFFLNRNTITGIDSRFENTPLAGFSNVYKALVKGHTIGSIVGNDYLYDEKGRKIIGRDGFPIAGNQLKVIGDPVPDFTIKLTQSLVYRQFSLVADWEWRKGGDVWNGTRAVLDYHGRSITSGEQRNIKQYVFDGVTESGAVNTALVDFYNPVLPVEQNRWVRYGYSGVAKDYIEKGSFIKLNNIALSYNIPVKKWLRKLELTAAAGNLFIWSAYKGVDPAQLLYDQPAAEGLDFFNLPSLKRYSLSVAVHF